MLANVILPYILKLYDSETSMPWLLALAMASEVIVFYAFQRGSAPFATVFTAVICANVVSTIAGAVLFFFIPYYPRHVGAVEIAVFFSAPCIVSIVLEYFVLVLVGKWRRFRKLPACVVVANVVSYAILGIGFTVHDYLAGCFK
jgi:hypothetical protein